MIGNFAIDPPQVDESLSDMVESHRQTTGQDYAAILLFGLWGLMDCSPEVRLYAGYKHLAEHPDDGPTWLELADVHAEAEEFAQAGHILDEIERNGNPGLYPQIYSEDVDVHRVNLLAAAGNYSEALDRLEALSARHGDTSLYLYMRAALLHNLSMRDEALAGYDEALEVLSDEEHESEDSDVDFALVREYYNRQRRDAEENRPFAGDWVLTLEDVVVDHE